MSRENVELVREGFARWNEGDYDFFLNSTAPDIELLSRFGSLTEHLVAEISHVIEPKVEAFEALLYIREPLAHSPVPSVRLAIGGIDLRARGSGLDMKEPMGWVFEFRDGRLARMRFYAQPAEALEAVGLRE